MLQIIFTRNFCYSPPFSNQVLCSPHLGIDSTNNLPLYQDYFNSHFTDSISHFRLKSVVRNDAIYSLQGRDGS